MDRVFVAESSESFRAASREQFYVSISRGQVHVRIFTDDKEALFEAVKESSMRMAAMDGGFGKGAPREAQRRLAEVPVRSEGPLREGLGRENEPLSRINRSEIEIDR